MALYSTYRLGVVFAIVLALDFLFGRIFRSISLGIIKRIVDSFDRVH
jgi:hypothetical protein